MNNRSRDTKGKAHGSAIISALFIMTMVAIVAVAMSTRMHISTVKTQLLFTHDTLYSEAEAVMFWGMADIEKTKGLYSVAEENTSGQVKVFPSIKKPDEQLQVSGALFDLQAFFNINNATDLAHKPLFARIAKKVCDKPDMKPDAQSLIHNIQFWLTGYTPEGSHASDYYLKQKPPYYPSHLFLRDLSELRLIKGIDKEVYQKISPYLCALPEITAININTAPAFLIKTLIGDEQDEHLKTLLRMRAEKPFSNQQTIRHFLKKWQIPEVSITTDSHYFLTRAIVQTADEHLTVWSIMKVSVNKKGKRVVNIIGIHMA